MNPRPPRHLVCRRAIWYWLVSALIQWVILLGGALVAALMLADAGHPTAWIVGMAVALLAAGVHIAVMPLWRFRVHRWEVTSEAVYTQAGWFNQELRIAPVSRIQTVDLQRGPLQRLFELATVTVTTASAAGPLHVDGLDYQLAVRLLDELTTTTQATPGDAT